MLAYTYFGHVVRNIQLGLLDLGDGYQYSNDVGVVTCVRRRDLVLFYFIEAAAWQIAADNFPFWWYSYLVDGSESLGFDITVLDKGGKRDKTAQLVCRRTGDVRILLDIK